MAVIFQPKSENNIAIAISLFIGAEIRNENVTPIGVVTNPKWIFGTTRTKWCDYSNKLANIFPKKVIFLVNRLLTFSTLNQVLKYEHK